MKPDIKYITPYLPYNLHFVSEGKTYELNQVQMHNNEFPLWAIAEWNEEKLVFEPVINSKSLGDSIRGMGFQLKDVKPLLKPLDSLLTDCPADIRNEFSDFLFYAFLKRIKNQDNPISIAHTSTFLTLLELHYDVFQLIPQGLALDINTFQL